MREQGAVITVVGRGEWKIDQDTRGLNRIRPPNCCKTGGGRKAAAGGVAAFLYVSKENPCLDVIVYVVIVGVCPRLRKKIKSESGVHLVRTECESKNAESGKPGGKV